MPGHPKLVGVALAGGSGVLYGSINVLSKYVEASPLAKSATAYLVSGLLLSVFLRGFEVARQDWWRILVMGLVGGGLAPVLLFYGLRETAAVDAGLLLTMEMVATAVLAYFFLHERVSRRAGTGLALLFLAAVLISVGSSGDGTQSSRRGVVLVLGSAVAWGVDNAVSAHLVGTYRPHQLIAVKGLIGGLAAATAMAIADPALPDKLALGQLALLGIMSIAVSSLLFYNALKHVGAARTSAMNIATTALVGAVGGSLLLDESFSVYHFGAFVLLAAGAVLIAETTSQIHRTVRPPG